MKNNNKDQEKEKESLKVVELTARTTQDLYVTVKYRSVKTTS